MKRALKWAGIGLSGIVVILVLAGGSVYGVTELRFRGDWDVQPEPIPIPTDSASIERGKHLIHIRGCVDCHGEDLGGSLMMDAMPMFGRLAAPNLTPGGRAGDFSSTDWARAIRHGVDPTGRALLFMPAQEFNVMSDEDLGAMVAYLESLEPVQRDLPANAIGPIARILYLKGDLALLPAELVDHLAPRPEPPEPGPTAEYGAYLATGCMGCHGEGYGGGRMPGTPPDFPAAANITLHDTGIGSWSEEDFFRALREGKRPDGSDIDPFMPWKVTAQMTDTEIRAIWEFLNTLPPKEYGTR